jgi:hypothetical protein
VLDTAVQSNRPRSRSSVDRELAHDETGEEEQPRFERSAVDYAPSSFASGLNPGVAAGCALLDRYVSAQVDGGVAFEAN